MKRLLSLALLARRMETLSRLPLLVLLSMAPCAKAWDDGLYRQIERSIEAPRMADAEFPITRYGARPDRCRNVFAHDISVRDCRFDGVAEGNNIKGLTQNVRLQNLFINGTLAQP